MLIKAINLLKSSVLSFNCLVKLTVAPIEAMPNALVLITGCSDSLIIAFQTPVQVRYDTEAYKMVMYNQLQQLIEH